MRMEFKRLWFIRIVVLSVFLLLEGTTDACLEHDRKALLQLKPFFNSHNRLSSWDEEGSDCCQWKGIECNITTRRLIGLSLNSTKYGDKGFTKLSSKLSNLQILDLSENLLNDSIILSLSDFSSLRYLSLAYNGFEGSSYPNGFQWLSRLNNLETLDLSGNYLKNNIMFHMSGLSSLKTLSLSSNLLEGKLLHIQDLNNLTNLKHLDLSWNQIESISNQDEKQLRLTKLEQLDLSYNLFRNNTFCFPQGLSSLKSLNMKSNDLKGLLDIKGLSYLKNLKYLDLSSNRIERISNRDETRLNLTKLEQLDLTDNLFRSNMFFFPKGLPSLKSLIMAENNLQGSLDIKELSNLTNLKKLDLSGNRIKSIQSFKDDGTKLQQLAYLEELNLDGNLLNNSVIASLNGFSNLKSLHISGNQLKGSLDMKDLDAFTSLRELYIRNNELKDFVIHKGWYSLKNLEVLDVSRNVFEGMLPLCLENLTSLRELDVSDNQFSGNLTPLTNLTSLVYLSLSRNHFQIPTSFVPLANLPNLKFLFIDENKMLMEPSLHTSVPKFQLYILNVSKCITSQELGLGFLTFLYYQYDLRYVDLSRNNFSGTLPIWLIENNTKLEYLILRDNSFSGPLSLPPAPRLNVSLLDISNNKLQGQIPSNICPTFPHLRRLFLSNNAIEGNIPPCLSGMMDLSFLDLSNNHLSGTVTEELILKDSLAILRLSNNNLSGNVIPAVFNANVLSNINLDGNNFSGDMTNVDVTAFDFLTSPAEIDISNNKLYGKLPKWIGNLSYLDTLAMSNNRFEGSIPMEFCNLNQLVFLDLSENNLSGSIPSCFSPPNIQHVHLHGNRLNGSLPLVFYNSSSLVTLDLSGNNLTGSIPEWISRLSSLSILLLKDNHLQGRIPIQLCKLYSLSILDLSQNKFSGPIPACLGNLTLPMQHNKIIQEGLYELYSEEVESTIFGLSKLAGLTNVLYPISYTEERIEFTTKKGSYSYGGNILEDMAGIDLSCNILTGHIPPELGNLSQIYSLNLSHNNLIGVIPSSFSKLKQLESLDLSYNNLTGEIPNQLVDLNSLEVFSVAHNNLSGSIPEPKAQFGTFDERSYEGNPFLCGSMLHKSCSKTVSPPTISYASNDEEEDSLLDIYVFRVSFFVSYAVMLLTTFVVLYINPYWRRVWFSFVENCITTCRYSAVGNFLAYYIFRFRSCV